MAPSSLTGILKDAEKYKALYYRGQSDVNKSRERSAKFGDVDKELLKWFTFARASNIPVSAPVMKAKAEEISRQLGEVDWSCSDGWLSRFKRRHSIVYRSVCGERGAVSQYMMNMCTFVVLIHAAESSEC